jgi:transcriptional regulator with XRE-family HTH domain
VDYVAKLRELEPLDQADAFAYLLGRRLADYRKSAELEQQAVARRLGMSQSGYSRLEAGESRCTCWQLVQIANLYHVPPGVLLP